MVARTPNAHEHRARRPHPATDDLSALPVGFATRFCVTPATPDVASAPATERDYAAHCVRFLADSPAGVGATTPFAVVKAIDVAGVNDPACGYVLGFLGELERRLVASRHRAGGAAA
jgi:hypothetical protein